MITGIIQIFALVVLYLLLRRASKQDLAKELELKDHIRTEIRNAVTIISNNMERSLNLSINTCEAHIKEHIDRSERFIAGKIYNMRERLDNGLEPLLADTRKDVNFAYDSLSSSLITVAEKQLPELISRLEALQTPLNNLTEAQLANTVKVGEARRTLYNRIKERDTAIANMQQAMETMSKQNKDYEETLASMKQTASAYLADLNHELSFIRTWMESKGMPVAVLDKALTAEFKDQVPSQIYSRVQNEKLLAEAVNS